MVFLSHYKHQFKTFKSWWLSQGCVSSPLLFMDSIIIKKPQKLRRLSVCRTIGNILSVLDDIFKVIGNNQMLLVRTEKPYPWCGRLIISPFIRKRKRQTDKGSISIWLLVCGICSVLGETGSGTSHQMEPLEQTLDLLEIYHSTRGLKKSGLPKEEGKSLARGSKVWADLTACSHHVPNREW